MCMCKLHIQSQSGGECTILVKKKKGQLILFFTRIQGSAYCTHDTNFITRIVCVYCTHTIRFCNRTNFVHAVRTCALSLFCTNQLFHKVAALARAVVSQYKIKLKRWNNIKTAETATTTPTLTSACVRGLWDRHNFKLKEYKDIFNGPNFWRKTAQTLDKDEAFNCLHSRTPEIDYILKGYAYNVKN